MSITRQRSQSLLDCPVDKINGMDKAREMYFLRLEQMNNNTSKEVPITESPRNDFKEEKPVTITKDGMKHTESILINKNGTRTRRSSTSMVSKRGFTEDMITFADVAGSYDVSGRLEGSVSPSPSVDFIPPHKAQESFDSYFY